MPSIDAARLLLGAAALAAASPAVASEFRVQADHVLGTSFEMAVTGVSEAQAEFAVAAARSEIDRLDQILSAWRADSELSRLNGESTMTQAQKSSLWNCTQPPRRNTTNSAPSNTKPMRALLQVSLQAL